jgi:hypothetical protein
MSSVNALLAPYIGQWKKSWKSVVSAKVTLKREQQELVEDIESFLERPAIAHSARIATAGFMAAFVTLLVIAFS